ncbi:hypothetical protein [Rhizobium sp. TRM95796]|uniref:hypothetical protein n=1 Tax=Rhizobium sp. TRM95796 TaxID=2979862 RepID=UPI0021E85751|nr:hypothetical protein [Rhizobium sp. TRM95796]MCV3766674.1 hypothetical protein [Rhizobium sp. TRM95796]
MQLNNQRMLLSILKAILMTAPYFPFNGASADNELTRASAPNGGGIPIHNTLRRRGRDAIAGGEARQTLLYPFDGEAGDDGNDATFVAAAREAIAQTMRLVSRI